MLRYNDKPWMSIRIKQLVKNRQLAFTQGDLVKWRFLRNKVQQQITKAKTNFYKNSICSLNNSQPAKWQRHNIQNICHLKPKPSTIPGAEANLSETAEAINRHFATICKLPAPSFISSKSFCVLTGRSTTSKDLSRAGVKSSQKSTIIQRLAILRTYQLD